MTIERAAELLQEWLDCDQRELGGKIESDYDWFVAERDEAVEVALEALEKQKALPPDEDRDDEMWYDFLCPHCHSILDFRYGYCPNCGQKLEWTEDETGDEP